MSVVFFEQIHSMVLLCSRSLNGFVELRFLTVQSNYQRWRPPRIKSKWPNWTYSHFWIPIASRSAPSGNAWTAGSACEWSSGPLDLHSIVLPSCRFYLLDALVKTLSHEFMLWWGISSALLIAGQAGAVVTNPISIHWNSRLWPRRFLLLHAIMPVPSAAQGNQLKKCSIHSIAKFKVPVANTEAIR